MEKIPNTGKLEQVVSLKEKVVSSLGKGKRNFFSGGVLPVIVLVVLPALYLLSFLFYSLLVDLFGETTAFISRIVILFIIYGIYVLFPLTYDTERFFKIRGLENTVKEYEKIKKILYFSIPLLVILAVVPLLLQTNQDEYYPSSTIFEPANFGFVTDISGYDYDYYSILRTTLLIVVIAGLMKIMFYLGRKEFWYYFAKSCFHIAMNRYQIDEVEKSKFLYKGLNSYNKYLRKRLNLQITDIKKVYSNLILVSREKKTLIVRSLHDSFEDDKLEPIRRLSSVLNLPSTEELLTKEQLFQKAKELVAIIAIIIPIVISIIQLLPNLVTPTTRGGG